MQTLVNLVLQKRKLRMASPSSDGNSTQISDGSSTDKKSSGDITVDGMDEDRKPHAGDLKAKNGKQHSEKAVKTSLTSWL